MTPDQWFALASPEQRDRMLNFMTSAVLIVAAAFHSRDAAIEASRRLQPLRETQK